MIEAALTMDNNNLLYRRHLRGAYVRVGASVILWLFALIAYAHRIIDFYSYAGISLSAIYLVIINPPTLWVLKPGRKIKLQSYISLTINALEVLGYTAIIYFAGGMSRSYLALFYPAMVSYVGVMAPRYFTFFITGFSSLALTGMMFLEYYQAIPQTQNYLAAHLSFTRQLFEVCVIVGFLFLIAFITSSTSQVIKKGKEQLEDQNEALKKTQGKLEEAREKAQTSDRMKSEFLANMSHELRTPLNHIIGFSELLADKHFGELNPIQAEYQNDILESSHHLLSLINDILDLSKIEAGKMELSCTEIPLKNVLESSLIMVREKALRHRIRLTTHFEDIPATLCADERTIKQILYNLLSNAVKFTPDSGSISLATKKVSGLEFGLPKENDFQQSTQGKKLNGAFVEISIKDTGIGLSPKDLERVFNPFEQGDNSASRKYQGTGLGLSLTKQLVELHGGHIWAESDGEGQGACFYFTLPLYLANQETKQ